MIPVRVHLEQRGEGEFAWVVLVGDAVAVSGLTRTEAIKDRMRLWWAQPEQRAAARERITGN